MGSEALRYINVVTGVIVGLTILTGLILTWKHNSPSSKLFTFGMLAYVVYSVGGSVAAIKEDLPITWVAFVLPIANIWITGAAIVLTVEKRHDYAAVAKDALSLTKERRDYSDHADDRTDKDPCGEGNPCADDGDTTISPPPNA